MRDSNTPSSRSRSPGRPREFDVDQALDGAVRVFSERGYAGTSIYDLTQAMQLAQGSLYKAFRDKQSLFLAALERYRTQRSEKLRRAVDAGATGRERLRNMLLFYADSAQGAAGKQGCLVVSGAVEMTAFEPSVAAQITAALSRNEALLGEVIRQGKQDGSVAAHVDPEATARLLLCLTQGMRVVGKVGRSRKDMLAIVDVALKVLG